MFQLLLTLFLSTTLSLPFHQRPPKLSKQDLESLTSTAFAHKESPSDRIKDLKKALLKAELAQERLLKMGFSKSFVNQQSRFIMGDYSPVILVHPLFGVNMRIQINCSLFKKANLRDFVKLKLFCKEYVCEEENEKVEDYLFVALNNAFTLNPETILWKDNNQYSACLGYVWKFYNSREECPENSCSYADGVRITFYGGTEETVKDSQCGMKASTQLVHTNIGEVIDELTNMALDPMYDINEKLTDLGYSNGFSKAAIPYDFRKYGNEKYFNAALNYMVNSLYENTGKKVVIIAHSYGNNKVYNSLFENLEIKDKVKAWVAIGPPFIGAAKIAGAFMHGYKDFNKKIGPITLTNMHSFGQSLIFNTLPSGVELRPMPLLQEIFKDPKYEKFKKAMEELMKIEEEYRLKDIESEKLKENFPNFYELYKDKMPMLDEAECKVNPKSTDDPSKDTEKNDDVSIWTNPCRNHLYDYINCPIVIRKDEMQNKTALDIKNYCKAEKKGYYVQDCKEGKCLDDFLSKARYPYDTEAMDDLLAQFNSNEDYKKLLEPGTEKLEKTDHRYFETREEYNSHIPKLMKKINEYKTLKLPIPPVNTYIVYSNFRRTQSAYIYEEKKEDFAENEILYRGGDGTVNSFSALLPGLKWLYDKKIDNLQQNITLVEFCSLLSKPESKYSYENWKKNSEKKPFVATYCNCINEDYSGFDIGSEKADTCDHGKMGKDPNLIKFIVDEVLFNSETDSVKRRVGQLRSDYEEKCNQKLYELFYKYDE